MENISPSITKNDLFDNLFIKFPLWFPILYIYLISNFPSLTNFLFIFTLFLFAETHFASTWFFFFDKDNWKWLKKNSYYVFFIPIYVAFIVVLIWFYNPSLIIIFHYLASGWHVTRQSVGLLNIYRVFNKIYTFLIYAISFLSLAIGLKNPGLLSDFASDYTNEFLLLFFLIYISVIYYSVTGRIRKNMQQILPFFTGIYIYLPLLFFKNISIATAIGVGMHWCQYLAIIWSTYLRKYKNKTNYRENGNFKINKFIFPRLIFVLLYALVMTGLGIYGMKDFKSLDNNNYSILFLIPLISQLYHFYMDGFIWRFSDKHIKVSIKPYIFSKNL